MFIALYEYALLIAFLCTFVLDCLYVLIDVLEAIYYKLYVFWVHNTYLILLVITPIFI